MDLFLFQEAENSIILDLEKSDRYLIIEGIFLISS